MESQALGGLGSQAAQLTLGGAQDFLPVMLRLRPGVSEDLLDRKSTRLNSSH